MRHAATSPVQKKFGFRSSLSDNVTILRYTPQPAAGKPVPINRQFLIYAETPGVVLSGTVGR
jgi:hypothetical protein